MGVETKKRNGGRASETGAPQPAARRAHHSEAAKGALINRLSRIEGQVRGVARMIGENQYCDDVLAQIASIESALNGVRRLLLEAHIRRCVVEGLREGRDGVVEGLMTTIGRMTR